MPLFRRMPKRGFSNAQFRKIYSIVNLKALASRFEDGDEIDTARLVKVGLVRDGRHPVKVLGEGSIDKKLTVLAAAFSKSAQEKITKAGGAAKIV